MKTEEDSFDNKIKEEIHPRFQENLSVNDLNSKDPNFAV